MAAGDVAEGVRSSYHGEAEGERHADKPDSEVRGAREGAVGIARVNEECGREDCGTATSEDQPEGAEKLGGKCFWIHECS